MNSNNNQTANDDDDLSSTTGSDFEPVDAQQQHEDVQEPLNDGNAQPTLAVSQPQYMTEMNFAALNARIHLLEQQLLLEKTKKEKAESVGLKARLEMLEQQQLLMQLQNGFCTFKQDIKKDLKQEVDDQISVLGTKLDEKLQNVKENVMEETRKLIQAEFSTFKQNNEKRFEKFEQEGVAEHALKLVNKQLLKEWLTTGVGLLRNVSLVRVASNELITFGGWSIQDGRLRAKKNRDPKRFVRAEKPFPVAGACPNLQQLLFYFEVTVITAKSDSFMYIGLCDANFPFTKKINVGNFTGSFAIHSFGDYWASGTDVDGHGEGEFASGDVVGCGLMILPEERRIFFTKSGEIWGKPILLGPDDAKADLYPIVSSDEPGDEVQFNFSGPFRYPLAHLNVVDG